MQNYTAQNQSWVRSDIRKGPDKGDKQRIIQVCDNYKLIKVRQRWNVKNYKKSLEE